MLKKIALAGIVLLVSVLSFSIATSTSAATKASQGGKINAPQAPAPHGWCLPPGTRC